MSDQQAKLEGPDLAKGASLADLPDGGTLLGHAHGEPVLLARKGSEVFAVGAKCTHYDGPLAEGLVVGETIRCPWHQAAFDLRTGAPSSPALDPIACYRVIRDNELVRVANKLEPRKPAPTGATGRVVIVGAGASGAVCAEALRRFGYVAPIVLLGQEPTPPIDRPNLSKDYLVGTASDEKMPLQGADFYAEKQIDFRPGTLVRGIDTEKKVVTLESGGEIAYEHLVLATGAEPRKLDVPGGERVLYLRTLADAQHLVEAAKSAKQAVVVGTSFIGLEVAAALRQRGLQVSIVGPEALPLGKLLGRELAEHVKSVHEDKGVTFHLGRSVVSMNAGEVLLDDGTALPAELVVAGVGVRPRTELAERAGLRVEDGVIVDASLRATDGVYVVGDAARYPDARTGELVRIEHWIVAERQGEHVARSIVAGAQGAALPYAEVPFFWTLQYDFSFSYVGHAKEWDRVTVDGNVSKSDATVRYYLGDTLLAVATVGRDKDALEAARDLRA